jgi:hypothetical protein
LTTQQSHVIDSSAGLSTLQHCCPCELGEIWDLEDLRSVAWRGRPTTFDTRCSRSVIQICKTCTFQLGNFMLMESNWVYLLRVSLSILHVKDGLYNIIKYWRSILADSTLTMFFRRNLEVIKKC